MMNMASLSHNAYHLAVIILLIPLISASGSRAAQDMGYLWVTSQPDYALVYVDGEYTNFMTPTPRLLIAEAGDRRIELVKQGYKLYQDEITIQPGRALKINVILAKISSDHASRLASKEYVEAYITVESKPPGADVYLDDELIGETPVIDREIQPGEPRDRKLRITKPGYDVHEQAITWVDIRDRVKIYVSAELKPAKQAVSTAPPDKIQRDRWFTINSQVIVLFIALVVMLAILTARIVIRLRQRRRD